MRGKIVRSGMSRWSLLMTAVRAMFSRQDNYVVFIQTDRLPQSDGSPYRSGAEVLDEVDVELTAPRESSWRFLHDSDFKTCVKLTLVLTVTTALFWGVWYLVAGEVPNATNTSTQLMSRWWDVLAALIYTPLLFWIAVRTEFIENMYNGSLAAAFGLMFGGFLGLTALTLMIGFVSSIITLPIALLITAATTLVCWLIGSLLAWIFADFF